MKHLWSEGSIICHIVQEGKGVRSIVTHYSPLSQKQSQLKLIVGSFNFFIQNLTKFLSKILLFFTSQFEIYTNPIYN